MSNKNKYLESIDEMLLRLRELATSLEYEDLKDLQLTAPQLFIIQCKVSHSANYLASLRNLIVTHQLNLL